MIVDYGVPSPHPDEHGLLKSVAIHFELLKGRIRQLYEDETLGGVRFRYALLVLDIITVLGRRPTLDRHGDTGIAPGVAGTFSTGGQRSSWRGVCTAQKVVVFRFQQFRDALRGSGRDKPTPIASGPV